MNLLFFQQYWWTLISLLGGLLVFLLFVQGGQTLIYTLGKTESERTLIVNSLGRKWEFTFTTLVTFGGAFFASFPLFYATSFGGAYWVWMCILFCFVLQAVSYEFRSKPGNFLGKRSYESFLFLNGAVGTLLLGVVVSTFFTGSSFSVDDLYRSRWETPWHGLEAVLNLENLALGGSVFFLSRLLASLYFINNIDHPEILRRSRRQVLYNALPFLALFLFFLFRLMNAPGHGYDPLSGEISVQAGKYYQNLVDMPLVRAMLLIGAGGIVLGAWQGSVLSVHQGIWYAGIGTVLAVWALFLMAGLNQTCFYPSTYDISDSLHIENSSSSLYTLKTMSWVSLLIPFVLGYIFIAWKAINREKISEKEINESSHTY